MLSLRAPLWLILSLSFTFQAAAYDEDTHFYATYAMARYAGIGQETALKIALSAQWMDEEYLTSPTSMVLLPSGGVHKRRLLHFPSLRWLGKTGSKVQDQTFGFNDELTGVKKLLAEKVSDFIEHSNETKSDGACLTDPSKVNVIENKADNKAADEGKFDLKRLAVYTQTQADSPFASSLLREGLREGDLMKAAASLHTLEDSFAHAGFSAEVGHTMHWHWPDRPFANEEAIKKYFRMTRAVFKALAAIRAQLPASALDCRMVSAGQKNCQLGGSNLATLYNALPVVQETVSEDVLKSVAYTKPALRELIDRAVEAGYFNAITLPNGKSLQGLLEDTYVKHQFSAGKLDTYDMLERYWITLLVAERDQNVSLINYRDMLSDLGLLTNAHISVQDYVRSNGFGQGMDAAGIRRFVEVLALVLLDHLIPRPINEEHKEEVENEAAPPRKLEMQMRTQNMQNLIFTLFNERIEFVENNSKDESGFVKEMTGDRSAEPQIKDPKPGIVYATFSLEEKHRFNVMIFRFLFPSLRLEVLDRVVKGFQEISSAWKVAKPLLATELFMDVKDHLRCYARDLAKSHLKLEGDEREYQNETEWEGYKQRVRSAERNSSLYPNFLIPEQDAWTEVSLKLRPMTLR